MTNPSNNNTNTAIVLLAYNSLQLVKQFLPKIIDTTAHRNDVDIWVVDNASTDNTEKFVRENFPAVNLYVIKVNHGFTGGYSESLPHISAANYVLISSDIEVADNWFDPAIELLNSADDIAAVQPKIMSFDNRNLFEYAGAAGGFIDALGFPFCRGRLVNAVEEDHGQYDNVQEIFWASGACLFVKADLYHKSGGLDNTFFAHMEEIDLAWRFKNMGHRVLFQPASKIFHMGGYVIAYGSPGKVFRNHRNNLIMLFKNSSLANFAWKLPIRLMLDHVAIVKMLLDGNPKSSLAVVRAHISFFGNLGVWIKSRNQVRKHFKNPNRFGIYRGSLVWNFYVKGIRKFSDLNWNISSATKD